MSTEQTESGSHYGDDGHSGSGSSPEAQPAETSSAGTAASSNGRRRRRRRKNRGTAPANGAPAAAQQPSGDEAPAAPVAAAPQPAPQGQSNSNSGGKRKNRKRSGGGGGGAPQPGNSNGNGGRAWQGRNGQNGWRRSEPDGNREGARGGFGSEHLPDNVGNGGGRRKGKFGRRGSAGFVGPMDHSYRAVNGNVADGPPSTMDYRNANANGNVHGRNDVSAVEVVAAPREDAPTRIVCFIEDLFVVAKMQEAARKLGVKVQFAKAEKETLASITDAEESARPLLIVFDLNNAAAKPLTTIPKLKAKLKRGTSIVGFLQQIQGDLKMKAIEAGCDTVMPRSAFSQSVPNLLRRYGFDEAEEMVEA